MSCYLLLRASDLRTQSAHYITTLAICDTIHHAINLARSDYSMRLPIIDPELDVKLDMLELCLMENFYYETIDLGLDTWYIIYTIPLNNKLSASLRPQLHKNIIASLIPNI